jgi:hypothetical protein
MANINQHPAGSLCWIELHAADQTAAQGFLQLVCEAQGMP